MPIFLWPLRSWNRTVYVFTLASAWAIFAGLRLDIGGGDYFAYRDYYIGVHGLGFSLHGQFEPLFIVLAWLSKSAQLDFHGFCCLIALLGMLPAIYVIERRSGNSVIGIVVYGIEFMLYGSFVILRQHVAMGIAFLLIDALLDRRFGKSLFFVVLAIGFHYSAFVLVFLPLVSFRFSPPLRTLVFCFAGLAGVMLLLVFGNVLDVSAFRGVMGRLFHYAARSSSGSGMKLNPLNIVEIVGFAWIFRRWAWGAGPAVENGFLIFMVFALYATIEAIFVRFDMYFKITVALLTPTAAVGVSGKFLGLEVKAWMLELVILIYFLAKIARWLLLNGGGQGGFLPYRTIFG